MVLNKAETIGTRWSDAAAEADRSAEVLGLPVFPVVAALAARTRTTTITPADLDTLRRHRHRTDPACTLLADRFLSAELGADIADRRALLERWDLYGVACALTALRHDPALTARQLLQILHCASGIDPLHHEIHRRYRRL
ncbi:hypothetical protein JK358_01300 [Nocardia sp. 2]|uniref:Uncharacterized protein n=1 Tax=Nocardia acididurans TaxID=2802282 RepID=A0ABS1LXX5_9NOCA|nr:hypothetical protein [Nocardia acididurans]MBL1073021.1 hypothetical protein [Nocardia acididurans]